MNNTEEIKKVLIENSSLIKKKHLSEEEVSELIADYHKAVDKVLLDYGFAQVSDNLRLEVVRLKKRNHVLRGQPYHNWRRYKLKVKLSWDYYQHIEESFNEFLEDDDSES